MTHNKTNFNFIAWQDEDPRDYDMHRVASKRGQLFDSGIIVKLCYGNQPKRNLAAKAHYSLMSRKQVTK